MVEEKKTRKKRQYSRNGCKECKRRKLKCDEGKPECWQCSHLGKKCIYIKTIKFSESRTLTAPKTHNANGDTSAKIEYNIVSDSPVGSVISPAYSAESTDKKEIINEATELASGLIKNITEESHFQMDDFIMDLTLNEYVKKQNVLSSFDLQEPHSRYLEIFYDKISAWLMPLEQNLCNEVLINHAKTSPYLLAAMLSLAAKDSESKLKYISTCLKNMNTVFQNNTNILQNIEPLILTVLLLAADSTSNNWRVHLRGAKDLFNKYIKFYQTPSLLLAKSWFAAIEILAGLTTFGTGKVHELDNLLDVGLYGENSEFSIEIGLLMPNGYNLFLGYSTEAIIMYREFFKLRKLDSMDLLFQMSLIHSAKEFQVANAGITISEDNPMHPNYEPQEKRIVLPPSCYGITSKNVVYSWFDIIHQLHVDALLLKIYNDFLKLPTDHYLIQDLVKGMLRNCFFFEADNKIMDVDDTRLLMIHGPMLSCGMNCVDVLDKLRIETYFQSLMKLEIYSANYSYTRVQNKWNGVETEEIKDLVPFA